MSEVHGIISFRKRRGRKMHFLVAGPCLQDAINYIAWGRVDRQDNGATVYQYFWTGNGHTYEITEAGIL